MFKSASRLLLSVMELLKDGLTLVRWFCSAIGCVDSGIRIVGSLIRDILLERRLSRRHGSRRYLTRNPIGASFDCSTDTGLAAASSRVALPSTLPPLVGRFPCSVRNPTEPWLHVRWRQ